MLVGVLIALRCAGRGTTVHSAPTVCHRWRLARPAASCFCSATFGPNRTTKKAPIVGSLRVVTSSSDPLLLTKRSDHQLRVRKIEIDRRDEAAHVQSLRLGEVTRIQVVDEAAHVQTLRLRGSVLNDEAAHVQTLRLWGSVLKDEAAHVQTLRLRGSVLKDEAAHVQTLRLRGSVLKDEAAQVQTLRLRGSVLNDEAAQVQTLRLWGSVLDDEAAQVQTLRLRGSVLNDEAAQVYALWLEGVAGKCFRHMYVPLRLHMP